MKTTSWFPCLLPAAVMVVAFAQPVAADADGLKPEGSWILTSSFPGGTFTSIASFTAGGVFLGTGSNDRLSHVSELHGTWDRLNGKARYAVSAYFFAFGGPSGPAVAMLKSNMAFKLTSRDTLVATGDLSSCDLQGNNCVLLPGFLSIEGKRIAAQSSSALLQLLPN